MGSAVSGQSGRGQSDRQSHRHVRHLPCHAVSIDPLALPLAPRILVVQGTGLRQFRLRLVAVHRTDLLDRDDHVFRKINLACVPPSPTQPGQGSGCRDNRTVLVHRNHHVQFRLRLHRHECDHPRYPLHGACLLVSPKDVDGPGTANPASFIEPSAWPHRSIRWPSLDSRLRRRTHLGPRCLA